MIKYYIYINVELDTRIHLIKSFVNKSTAVLQPAEVFAAFKAKHIQAISFTFWTSLYL